jgi:hypothetical protein
VLTAEQVRAAIRETCAQRGAAAPPGIIVAGSDRFPGGHDPGHGPLAPGVEDLLRVTDDGVEVLTDFPYDLAPRG